jgi:plastocyanin
MTLATLSHRSALALAIAAGAACSSASGSTTAGGSPDASATALNGCAADMFVDGSNAATVDFGGASGSPLFGYAPACLRVPAGASVRFVGDFSVHPMSPGTSPTATTAGSANNPIEPTDMGSSSSVTFPTVGTYPYFCQMHYAAGMAGVVLVQ